MAGAGRGTGRGSSELKTGKDHSFIDAAFLEAIMEALLAADKEPWEKKRIPLTQML